MSGVVLTPLWSESQTSRQQVTVFGWMQYLSSKHSLNFSIYYGFYQDRLFLAEKWTLNAINLVWTSVNVSTKKEGTRLVWVLLKRLLKARELDFLDEYVEPSI